MLLTGKTVDGKDVEWNVLGVQKHALYKAWLRCKDENSIIYVWTEMQKDRKPFFRFNAEVALLYCPGDYKLAATFEVDGYKIHVLKKQSVPIPYMRVKEEQDKGAPRSSSGSIALSVSSPTTRSNP
ncbi:hypothetical protein [Achromobacter phage Motura]|uniref:Uncharacterized protein n=1 Tax=Achromobacter phage Motura TaxID=2591403 RepID=A0A514CSK8_9CAUD|nr:hypothetical protein H1O15_gp344 [Achromobacter phage Motura]QDH83462.1 hypothetical protein [Achromobacter phage Motura]